MGEVIATLTVCGADDAALGGSVAKIPEDLVGTVDRGGEVVKEDFGRRATEEFTGLNNNQRGNREPVNNFSGDIRAIIPVEHPELNRVVARDRVLKTGVLLVGCAVRNAKIPIPAIDDSITGRQVGKIDWASDTGIVHKRKVGVDFRKNIDRDISRVGAGFARIQVQGAGIKTGIREGYCGVPIGGVYVCRAFYIEAPFEVEDVRLLQAQVLKRYGVFTAGPQDEPLRADDSIAQNVGQYRR